MGLWSITLLIIVGIPVFFFWRWVYSKKTPAMRRRLLIWLTTIVTTPLLIVLFLLAWLFSMEYYPNHDFDAQAWKADSDKRYEYSKDLISSRLLIGKNRQQVEQLLGKNSDTSRTELYYYIGYRPEITGIDPSNILIKFKSCKVDTVIENDR